jgi:hypothetical protein
MRYQRSILDLVEADARALSVRVNGPDRHKLDEYLTAVREIEQRVERAGGGDDPPGGRADVDLPEGVPASYEEHLRLLADMLALAFQTDTTRVATYMFANGQQQALSVHRREGRASHLVAPREQPREADAHQRNQPVFTPGSWRISCNGSNRSRMEGSFSTTASSSTAEHQRRQPP